MTFVKQVWTLTKKNLLLIVVRHWFWTFVRALAFPVVLAFVVCYSRNWLNSPALYGIGTQSWPIRSLPDAIAMTGTARSKVVFSDHNFADGDMDDVINSLSATFRDSGITPSRVHSINEIMAACPGNLAGVTECWGAVAFTSSPDHPGKDAIWDYTLLGDSALGGSVTIDENTNDAQLYLFPFQHAIDAAIVATDPSAPELPSDIRNMLYTSTTEKQRQRDITNTYQILLFDYLLVLFFIAMSGITYQMVGFMASEREQGLTELIDTMMPSRNWYHAQAVRFISLHLAFDIIYLPSWIVIGALLSHYAFPDQNAGLLIVFHITSGLSLSSLSLLAGAFFKKAHLSGITIIIISLVLAISALYGFAKDLAPTSTIIGTGFLFPPMNYIFFLEMMAWAQRKGDPLDLSKPHPVTEGWTWGVSAATFLGLLVVQIVLFPCFGSAIERILHGVSGKGRTVTSGQEQPFAVRIRELFVEYRPSLFGFGRLRKGKTVQAVQNLSLDWLPGSITVLLGVNGSGKTTIMNAISGQKNITQGTIEVDGTGGFGICPQKNVMWNDLTVAEHVTIFTALKSMAGHKTSREEVNQLIAACDLDLKQNAKSKTLSGGQKRKLQLAMMFAGGSRVCCIDEVSSGIDPLARRKIWDILLAERHTRSILLTTHYLEEADVLADHIAIMSKGTMKLEGSAVQLKSTLGGGYRIVVEGHVPTTVPLGPYTPLYEARQTHFLVPDSAAVATLLLNLERNGYNDYRVQDPTTENVFLDVAEELKEEEFVPDEESKSAVSSQGPLNLTVGHGTGLLAQTWILLRKRLTILRSSYMPYVCALFIPLCTAGMVTLFFINITYPNGIKCTSREPQYSYPYSIYDYSLTSGFVYGPAETVELDVLTDSVRGLKEKALSRISNVSSLSEFADTIARRPESLYTGGFYDGDSAPLFAWQGDGWSSGLGYSSLLLNVVHQLLSQTPIRFGYETFEKGAVPEDTAKTMQVAIFGGLALCVYPALFALYPTLERVRQVRALHYSNGIRSGPLWAAYFIFDFAFVLVISIFIVVIWSIKWAGWYGLGYLFVVLVLYGMTSIAYSYCISMFVRSQLGAFAASAGTQCLFFIVYFVTYITAQTYAPPDQLQTWLNYEYFTICLFTPAGNMLRALLVSVNSFFILCRGEEMVSYPGEITVYGGPILYLIVQFVLLVSFLIYWDAGGRFRLFGQKHQTVDVEDEQGTRASDEAKEDPARLQESKEGIQMHHITKRFGSNTALEDVTLGIRRSETVALLGPNGAGKSTLISLMRGDLRPSDARGRIIIEGHSIADGGRTAARSHLGVCGQFDAMDAMTVRQQLAFYARARGVPAAAIAPNVAEVLRAFRLTQYEHRLAGQLSGGNQRKLSLACALVGGPSVLLLDEPSSGMDPAAKRVLWRQLAHIAAGRVLLLSTHSMEEADALCERAVILARRLLALGSTESLREKHGALHVHVVHRDAPHARAQDMENLRAWVVATVPGARVEERTYHGQLRFSVPKNTVVPSSDTEKDVRTPARNPVGALFELMERHKESLGVAYYSIGRTTLDDVFLSVVRKHNVMEENYGVAKRRKAAFGLKWFNK